MRFEEHYNCDCDGHEESDDLEIYMVTIDQEILTEIAKQFLKTNTDRGRIRRAQTEIRKHPPKVTFDKDGNRQVEYNFKAHPSTEFKRHWGYVIHKGDDVKELFCDCKDFFYRLYAPMVDAGLAQWNLIPKYKRRLIKRHNRQWTKETNPTGTLFVCKHLYALLSEYVNDKYKPLAGVKISRKKKKEIEKKRQADLARQAQDKEKEIEIKKDVNAEKRAELDKKRKEDAKKKIPPKKEEPTKEEEPEEVEDEEEDDDDETSSGKKWWQFWK